MIPQRGIQQHNNTHTSRSVGSIRLWIDCQFPGSQSIRSAAYLAPFRSDRPLIPTNPSESTHTTQHTRNRNNTNPIGQKILGKFRNRNTGALIAGRRVIKTVNRKSICSHWKCHYAFTGRGRCLWSGSISVGKISFGDWLNGLAWPRQQSTSAKRIRVIRELTPKPVQSSSRLTENL